MSAQRTLSVRAAHALWSIGIHSRGGAEPRVRAQFRRFMARSDWRRIRNCGVVTIRELQTWAGLPLTPLPGELKGEADKLAKELCDFVLWLTPCGEVEPAPSPFVIGIAARKLNRRIIAHLKKVRATK